jgi:hypothetical protein
MSQPLTANVRQRLKRDRARRITETGGLSPISAALPAA